MARASTDEKIDDIQVEERIGIVEEGVGAGGESVHITENSPNHDGGRRSTIELAMDRRAALADVDNAEFSWFHAKVCVVAGVGFCTDAYDIFAINIASTMLGYVYGTNGELTANQDFGIKVATPVGTLVGQLFFGWVADLVGRKRMYGAELMIMVVATFGQALAGQGDAVSIIGALVVWRFIVSAGIGGDYPLSAIISSEFAATRIRGRMVTAVFASQGWGNFLAGLVAFIATVAFKDSILASPTNSPMIHVESVDAVWRLFVGIGCIPAVAALYFRLTIPETPRFTMDIEKNIQQARADIKVALTGKRSDSFDKNAAVVRLQAPEATWSDFLRYFSQWKNGKVLFGTSWSWFSLDIAFYGLNLNTTIIIQAIGFNVKAVPTSPLDIYENLRNICIGNMILAAAGLIPGYWMCFLFIDSWGRKPIQLMGFIVLTILFVILGFAYDKLTQDSTKVFVFLTCLANFFSNFGPNTTTFVIPGEVFPTRYRSTCHGISAASGKLGAIVAQVTFAQLRATNGGNKFIKHIFEIFALFMVTGVFSTLLLPATENETLEVLSGENQDTFIGGTSRPQHNHTVQA
ncbi:MFS general substrate transporter [Macrolepiota fuliginosa MF-IS2]|uniref:MFS general substrate transporter n=1 Tax=Macrolepiota fuliginosa MF-IS2 TaxID=1400762 RepID=A0A9P5XB86_9AGAR|nr:MFS general substrate transporter [Macrolepiota fuliginosa MF-IS2]